LARISVTNVAEENADVLPIHQGPVIASDRDRRSNPLRPTLHLSSQCSL
jgi:hypothetical protein